MSKNKDLTVMVSACAYQFMPALSNCLRNNGERKIRIVGTDMNYDETVYEMVDSFYQVPKASDPNYSSIVLDICKKERVDVVLPTMSAELLPLLDNIDKFEKEGIKVSVSNRESIITTNNKLNFYNFMKDNNLPMVDFYPVNNVKEVKEAFSKLGYPNKAICIKALESSGSRGIRIVDPKKSRYDILFNEKPNSFYISYEELIEILSEKDSIPKMAVMEAIPGEEFSIDLLADHGEVKYMCGRESNTILASIPQTATLFKDEEAYDICRKVVSLLKIDGNADFDFKYDENHKPILMEVNPRIAATMAIFKEGGLNLPYLRIKQLLGEELPEINIKYGIKMVRRYLEMYTK